ncbi:MAG: hypothetical protein EBU88_00255 [Acidobacteria bacterium]|nr:hypothetical protein [Acidobacteriota bacterium]
MAEDSGASSPEFYPEFYEENGRVVFTRIFHLRRGFCCGSGCRHCPFTPRWQKGATTPTTEPPDQNR